MKVGVEWMKYVNFYFIDLFCGFFLLFLEGQMNYSKSFLQL